MQQELWELRVVEKDLLPSKTEMAKTMGLHAVSGAGQIGWYMLSGISFSASHVVYICCFHYIFSFAIMMGHGYAYMLHVCTYKSQTHMSVRDLAYRLYAGCCKYTASHRSTFCSWRRCPRNLAKSNPPPSDPFASAGS